MFFCLQPHILTAMYQRVHCHILLVNYEVMLCALITCLSEDPKLCIDLLRCAKHMLCVMLIAMAIYSTSVINHIYFGKKPLSFLSYAYTMVLFQRLPVVILAFLRVVFYCLFVCCIVLKLPEGESSLETEAQIISFCPCGTFHFLSFFFSFVLFIFCCCEHFSGYLNNQQCNV